MKMLLLLVFFHVSSPVKHSLTYLRTGSFGIPNMPDYMLTAKFDELQVDHCDSNKTRSYPSFWEKLKNGVPQILEWFNMRCLKTLSLNYEPVINRLKEIKPNEAVHVLQCMCGCKWDENSGNVSSFVLCSYNGEDLLEMDLKILTWIVQNPLGDQIKPLWDAKAFKTDIKNFLTETCPEWLKTLVAINPLKETDLPSVSLLQKTPSSPVSCHATGFYPSRALMFWRKDGEEIHEGVEHRDILPNHDETFQMSVDLNVSSIPPGDWRRYDCVFQLSGGENITTILDKTLIRTNLVSPSEFPSGAVIGCSVGLLLLVVVCITGLFMWKKKYEGFRPANTSNS